MRTLVSVFAWATIVATQAFMVTPNASAMTAASFEASQLLRTVSLNQVQQVQPDAAPAEVDSAVIDAFSRGEQPDVLVRFHGAADVSFAQNIRGHANRASFVYNTLTSFSSVVQAEALDALQGFGRSESNLNDPNGYMTLWIDNSIAINSLRQDELEVLSSTQGVRSITEQEVYYLPIDDSEFEAAQASPVPDAPIGSISQINAPDVWALGFRGAGITVSNNDSGVRHTHAALVNQYRGNNGGGSFTHNHNWFDPYSFSAAPRNSGSHGTHVMGTIAGSDGSVNEIGVAPDADWIACIGFGGSGGSATQAGLIACGQFALAPPQTDGTNPDPTRASHVHNNSWGNTLCNGSYNPWYEATIDNLVAAGVVPIFSMGNASNCGFAPNPPIGQNSSPSNYGKILSIGSSANTGGTYATHSIKGTTSNPSPGLPSYPDHFGFANLKPNVIAPGVSIFSSVASGDASYGLSTGTSMSSPAVAGLVALMWDAAPCLIGDYPTTGSLIMSTATQIAGGTVAGYAGSPSDGPGGIPNQATGWGEVDALAAVNAAIASCDGGVPEPSFYDGALTTTSPTFDNPGGSGLGSGIHYYCAQEFTADATGTYVIETTSPNTTGTPSNALDTFLLLYANTFNPAAPAGAILTNDDFTGALTVLPGPYAGTVTATSTGFQGTQPGSRLAAANLTAGTTYFLVQSSFRETNFVSTGTQGQSTGPFFTGIGGPGNITLVGTGCAAPVGGDPVIDVDPLSLSATVEQGASDEQTLTIANLGGTPLDWSIEYLSLAAGATASAQSGMVGVAGTSTPAATGGALSRADESAGTGTTATSGRSTPSLLGAARQRGLADGLLLIPDSAADRVMAFDATTGDLVDADFIPFNAAVGLATPKQIILNAEGDGFLLVDQIDDLIHGYDLDGNWTGAFAPSGGVNTAVADNMRSIAYEPGGGLIATIGGGGNNNSVAEFDPVTGDYVGQFIAAGAGGLAAPFYTLFRDADIIVPSNTATTMFRFNLDGTFVSTFSQDLDFVQQLQELPSGNILAAHSFTSAGALPVGIVELDGTGALIATYEAGAIPRGVYQLPNGNILATNSGSVVEINRATGIVDTKISGVGPQFITFVQTGGGVGVCGPTPPSWLSVDPLSGSTAAGGSSPVTVSFDSTGLAPGDYSAELCITSNDPATPEVQVPVELTVTPGGGGGDPEIEVAPLALDFSVAAGASDSDDLSIGNVGDGVLTWTIDSAEPAASVPLTAVSDQAGVGAQDLRSGAGFAIGPAVPTGGVDCAAEPGIIIQDDGSIENGYSGNAASGVTEVRVVDRFTPASYPASIASACVAFISQGPTSLSFDFVVYDDDGAAGAPGSLLGSVAATASGIPTLPLNPVPTFFSADLSSLGLQVTEGSVYIGVRYAPLPAPNVFVASDESVGNPVGFAGGYFFNNVDNVWNPTQVSFPAYRSAMIRAALPTGGPGPVGCANPATIPWLAIGTASGSAAAGETDLSTITVDSTGLAAGDYEALLCVDSNDPVTPLVEVPVSLTVTGGGGGDPVIAVAPTALVLAAPENGSAADDLAISNVGQGTLTWTIDTAEPAMNELVAINAGKSIASLTAGLQSSAGLSLENSPGLEIPQGGTQMSQTPDSNIVAANSVACDGGENRLLRRFYFDEHPGVSNPANIGSVDVAIQEAAGTTSLTVNLYTLAGSTPVDTIPVGSLTLIGTGTVPISAANDGGLVNVPVTGTVANTATTDLVVEIVGGVWYIGATDTSQTHPGFIVAPDCSITTPTAIDTIGADFADTYIVMVVNADGSGPGPLACDTPSSIPWLDIGTASGSAAAGETDLSTITANATGLVPGVYQALLCVDSNDPVTPTVEVPVEFTVEGDDDTLFANGFECEPGFPGCDAGGDDIVVIDNINFVPNPDFTGGAIQWLDGTTCDCDTAPFNFNVYGSPTAVQFFWPLNANESEGGVSLDGTNYSVLASGATIGSTSQFVVGTAAALTSAWTTPGNVDGFLGFRFDNAGTVNYGYARITTGAGGRPVTIVSLAYNSAGDPITIP